jgi:hypothetical protein
MHTHATDAQLARTMLTSTQPGTTQVAWGAHPFRVRHSVDAEGRPLLLCRTDGALDRTLRPVDYAAAEPLPVMVGGSPIPNEPVM